MSDLPDFSAAAVAPEYKVFAKGGPRAPYWVHKFTCNNLKDARNLAQSLRTDGWQTRITYLNQVVE
jgi:hypothetical protein